MSVEEKNDRPDAMVIQHHPLSLSARIIHIGMSKDSDVKDNKPK